MQVSSLIFVCVFLVNGASAAFKFAGTNEAGADFGSSIPGVYMTDYTFPRASSIDYFVQNGMNTFRVPFLWERIQPVAFSDLDATYAGYLDATVRYITVTKGVYCVIDVHNYAQYYSTQIGNGVPYSAFADLWTRLATRYMNNPKVVFGLMNEPHDMPYANVLNAMQVAINAIRTAGATNLITVPGNDWTGVHSWIGNSDSWMIQITDPLNNFIYEMHQYFDNNFSGNGACVSSFDANAIFGPVTSWLRQNNRKVLLGEFGIENTPQCLAVLQRVMAYLQANDDVWIGYTWWAAGPWWGTYKFSLESGVGDAQLAVIKQYTTVSSSSSSTPAPPMTTAAPKPVTTAAPKPVTTAAPKPVTTAAPKPITTAAAVPSTTGRVSSPAPSSTGAPQLSNPVPQSSGASKIDSSTTTSAPSSTITPSNPPPSCRLGDMACIPGYPNQYLTCGWADRTNTKWFNMQCNGNLQCHPDMSSNAIHCY